MARRIVPSPDPNVRLRAATSQDRDFVEELSAIVFSEFGDYGSCLPRYLEESAVFTSIYEEHGGSLGFIMLALVLNTQTIDEPAQPRSVSWFDSELLAIAVVPSHQNRGIGKHLLRYALDFGHSWHATAGVRSLQLNVAETNQRARALFERMGFVVLNPHDGTYPKGQRSLRMIHRFED
jgi:ribosomal protein S18 acetylase RimI-like enzyme